MERSQPSPKARTGRMRAVPFRGLEGAWLVLLLSVGGTLVAWRYATERSLEVQRTRFHTETRQLTTAVSQQVELFLDALRGLQALYAGSKSVERDEFTAYLRRTDFLVRHPEVWAVWFAERVTAQDREAFEARVRADTSLRPEGYPDFAIYPAGERAEFFVVTYQQPTNERLLGVDLASDPSLQEAFGQARDTGEPVATGPIVWLSDTSRGVLLVLPVYRHGVSISSLEERRRALVGFVAGVVDTEALLRTMMQETRLCPGITLNVSDGSGGAEGQPAWTPEHLLYQSPEVAGLTGRTTAAPLRAQTTLAVGWRIWVCRFAARPDCPFLKPGDRTPLLVLVLGLVFSLLVFGILASLATSRLRAMKLAEDMTKVWRTTQGLLMARASQQAAVTELSQRALADADLSTLFDYAVQLVTDTLPVELCKILELQPDGASLRLCAGVGWNTELIGRATVPAGPESPAGSALQSDSPVVVEDLRTDTRFTAPALLQEHGVISGMSVVIAGQERPFGVLGAHAKSVRRFSEDDVQFLQDIANVLASAIRRKRLEGELRERSAALEQNNVSLMRQQAVAQSLLEDLQVSKDRLEAVRRQLEQSLAELRETKLQLIQSEKLESVGRLAAGVAHEVKNPLAIILMGAEYLAKHVTDGDETTGGVLKDMEEAVKRADRVIKGLLDFSASRTLEVAPQAFRPIVEQALLFVKHALMKACVTTEVRVADDLPPLALDRQKLEQVFVNLFMNAIHAMPEGGTLTVTAAVTWLVEAGHGVGRRAIDRFRIGDEAVTVTIDDTGTGIPADQMPKIFDPFFTTKPTGQGTGLGLTVVQKIVELHGGMIDVANRPEGGARVTVLLPVPRGAAKVR